MAMDVRLAPHFTWESRKYLAALPDTEPVWGSNMLWCLQQIYQDGAQMCFSGICAHIQDFLHAQHVSHMSVVGMIAL